jgi:serine/threonine protein kinase
MLDAPECRRSITDNTVVPVSQKIDVWSMGCVLSKAATWIILGFSGIQNFEKHLSTTEDQRALARFHDGKNVLPSVQNWHKILRQNIHTRDHLTGKILDLVDNHLLQGDPRLRFDSKELCAYLGRLLQEREETPPSMAQGPFPTQSFYLNPDGIPSVLSCRECAERFTGTWREGNFARHLRLKHRSDLNVSYSCSVCHKSYARSDALLKHERNKHERSKHERSKHERGKHERRNVHYPTISFYPEPEGLFDGICELCAIPAEYCAHSSVSRFTLLIIEPILILLIEKLPTIPAIDERLLFPFIAGRRCDRHELLSELYPSTTQNSDGRTKGFYSSI